MPDMTFNTTAGAAVSRELMVAYLNTGSGNTATWSPIGKRVPDSSMDLDWSDETSNDILGNTFTTLKKPTITQTFEPGELDSDDAAQLKIWNLAIKEHNYQALTAMDVLIVHFYAGESASPFAERYSACAIRPTGLGGEGGGSVGMPVEVTYGGTRTTGTASKDASTGAITFTPQ